jgi:hypothetical protein
LARSLPSSRHSHAAALIVTILVAAALTLLAFSSQSLARARKGACPSSSAAHVRHVPRACAQSKRTSKPSHKGKAHARARVKGHHGKHAATKKQAAEGQPAKTTTKPPAPASQTPAICEDGSAPLRAGDGSFSCDDESDPVCENGATPAPSSDGSSLVCAAAGPSGYSEATCEDGSAPLRAGDGSFFCDDESEPTCEDGSEPTLRSDHALRCNAPPGHYESVG